MSPYEHKGTLLNDPDGAIQIVKEQAVEAASRGADTDWLLTAMRAVRVLARKNQYITSDDVWRWMQPFQLSTPDNRAMGAVMRCSKDDDVIEATSDWRISERSCCHGRPVRVWKSLRYESK